MVNQQIRILIVDDHEIIRDGLQMILETAPDIDIVGLAADGAQGVELAERLLPHVILLDLRMPVMDGISALRQIRQTLPNIAVVVLTTYNEDDLMVEALQCGARGYLLKDTDRETLFNTIRAAAEGKTLLQPEILARVMQQMHTPAPQVMINDPLTARELEILTAVAQGERNKEIAFRLGITERTVKAHLAHIFDKLGVDSRASAVALGLQRGLIVLGKPQD